DAGGERETARGGPAGGGDEAPAHGRDAPEAQEPPPEGEVEAPVAGAAGRARHAGAEGEPRPRAPAAPPPAAAGGAPRPGRPAGPRMTMAGTVSHLRWAERCWFEVVFLGRPAAGPQFNDGPEGAGPVVPGRPLAQLLADYERQCALSNEIVAAHSLDDVGKHPALRA